ncbi:hypothetical protein [Pseudomonas sp. H9]|uniref:hypothetical protein n=1 Tax=Pseudomonas sp. H9 TaxID=483968 RepID=UPI001057845C|nr:hypothetical protein [Pseudomonas sp. H9]TDF77546.1 hypothetical protein E1573_25655 [Pseudomonas sp. H9]
MNIINSAGWQQLASNPIRYTADAITERQAQFHVPVASSGAAPQQQSRGNTAQQNTDQSYEEAMAKLKVQLQTLKQFTGTEADTPASSAVQEFRDYMALSPAEKIKEKLLNELGMTKEEFDALPPEEKDKIERKIAEQMKEETELDSLATLSTHLQRPSLVAERDAKLT